MHFSAKDLVPDYLLANTRGTQVWDAARRPERQQPVGPETLGKEGATNS